MNNYSQHIKFFLIFLSILLALLSYSGPSREALNVLFNSGSDQSLAAQCFSLLCLPVHSLLSHSEASYLICGFIFFVINIFLLIKCIEKSDLSTVVIAFTYLCSLTTWHRFALNASSLQLLSILALASILLDQRRKYLGWPTALAILFFIDFGSFDFDRTLELLQESNSKLLWLGPAFGLLALGTNRWTSLLPLYIFSVLIVVFESSEKSIQLLLALVPAYSVAMAYGLSAIKRHQYAASIGVSYIAAFLFVADHIIVAMLCVILAATLFLFAYLENGIKLKWLNFILISSIITFGLTQIIFVDRFKRNTYFTDKQKYISIAKKQQQELGTIISSDLEINLLRYWNMQANLASDNLLSLTQVLESTETPTSPYTLIYRNSFEHPFFEQGNIIEKAESETLKIRSLKHIKRIHPLISDLNSFDRKQENWTFDFRKVDRQKYTSSPYGHKLDRYSPTLTYTINKNELPPYIKRIRINAKVNWFSDDKELPKLVSTLNAGDSILQWKSSLFEHISNADEDHSSIDGQLYLDLDNLNPDKMVVYIWNPNNLNATIDDFELAIIMY